MTPTDIYIKVVSVRYKNLSSISLRNIENWYLYPCHIIKSRKNFYRFVNFTQHFNIKGLIIKIYEIFYI